MEELIPLPKEMPKTQSFYYMPLLTHAYYTVKKLELTSILKKHIRSIKQLPLLTEERYLAMLEGVIWFLTRTDPSYINKMEMLYALDTPHSVHNVGHIHGNIQEEILSKSYLSKEKYNLYFKYFKNDYYGEDKRIIKNVFDTMITCYYNKEMCNLFYNEEIIHKKYLKYKNKYLQLKNKLNKV
jgi:hypothetical protein